MTGHPQPPEEQPIDLAVLAADDRLLDDLGRGGPAPDGDPVAALLAGWRADLDGDSEPAEEPAVSAPARRRPSRVRWIVAAAAAVLLAGGGLVVAAGGADPDSPLWPITRVVYPRQADTAAAEHAIARARRAAEQGRYRDAQRLIAEAETLVSRVSDPAQAGRLRAELDAVRALVPAAVPAATAPPGASPTPTTGPTGGGAGPGGGGGPATPAPGPTTAGPGQGRPGLPLPPILPSVGVPPLPLPSLPLPLPSLPIIGGGH
jgi:hypothetical protein